ncbi:hypothetical protein BDN70DRAFT_902233 [Pholiota conissans]|uniref:Uncharacterized protein n=1 Tax=Pholiota conissans TaxID=109636 RepID=A0A9P5YI30_9AGAR|nr:hypothetical protein BDN70DRAFT_902233 [Pholiota conissans]
MRDVVRITPSDIRVIEAAPQHTGPRTANVNIGRLRVREGSDTERWRCGWTVRVGYGDHGYGTTWVSANMWARMGKGRRERDDGWTPSSGGTKVGGDDIQTARMGKGMRMAARRASREAPRRTELSSVFASLFQLLLSAPPLVVYPSQ